MNNSSTLPLMEKKELPITILNNAELHACTQEYPWLKKVITEFLDKAHGEITALFDEKKITDVILDHCHIDDSILLIFKRNTDRSEFIPLFEALQKIYIEYVRKYTDTSNPTQIDIISKFAIDHES